MAAKGFSAPHQQAVLLRCELSVSHLQLTTPGLKRQQPCHGVLPTLEIRQGFPQQQHAAALGIDRSLLSPGCELMQAAAAAAQLGCMLLRKATGKDQTSDVLRQRLIGQRTPGEQGHPHPFQQFAGFRVAEVEGGIRRQRDRQGAAAR